MAPITGSSAILASSGFIGDNTIRLQALQADRTLGPEGTNQHQTALGDKYRESDNFHYRGMDVTFHIPEGETLESDAVFRFTIEGDYASGSPEVIPEPSSSILIGLSALTLLTRRKRK